MDVLRNFKSRHLLNKFVRWQVFINTKEFNKPFEGFLQISRIVGLLIAASQKVSRICDCIFPVTFQVRLRHKLNID